MGLAVKFAKPFLTFDEQVEHLLQRGMLGDPQAMRHRLQAVNYYRLSAYWHTFRAADGERFLPETRFDVAWERYAFDRELRVLVIDAVERFEVAVRTRLAYEHASAEGPFGYLVGVFRDDPGRNGEFRGRLDHALKQSRREPYIEHFRRKYGDEHPYPPVWVAVETLMFGDLVSMFKGSSRPVRRRVADYFGVADIVLDSWLLSINLVRNICAHHGRLWNRELGVKPKIPRDEAWERPVRVSHERIFAVLTILADVMWRIAPGSRWSRRVRDLLEQPAIVPLRQMGFPAEWTRCTIWQRAWEASEAADGTS